MAKIALIIGHSMQDGGAYNKTHRVSEFQFNTPLAQEVAEMLKMEGHDPVVIYRDCSYSKLPSKVNATGAALAVSFHCNAFDTNPHGSEVLYFKGSNKGLLLASAIQERVVSCLKLPDRGIKGCVAAHVGKAGDRGGYLLEKTSMPCVIVEPFFIDSDSSLELANSKFELLAEAYTQGIVSFIKGTK
jgi:N-acetylmuramoyl-L-alanine amidase